MVPVRGRVAQPRPGRSGDGAVISRAGKSKNPSETWEKLRWAGCCARGPRWNCRAYSFVYSYGCGDEAASRKISHPALQAVDAHRTCGLVAGSAAGSGYLRALVHSASFSTLRLLVRFACGRRKDMYRRNHGCVPNGAAGPGENYKRYHGVLAFDRRLQIRISCRAERRFCSRKSPRREHRYRADVFARKLSARPGFDYDCHADARLGVQDHPDGGSEWREI